MFRPMRRNRQLLPQDEAIAILNRHTWGTLALAGDDGYPYAVPLNYIYEDGKLYFHCAREGHKLDALKGCDKVSFSVVDADDILEEKLTTLFRSVTVFGRARTVEDDEEKQRIACAFSARLCPHESAERIAQEAAGAKARLGIIAVQIEHMTGKECKEFALKR